MTEIRTFILPTPLAKDASAGATAIEGLAVKVAGVTVVRDGIIFR